MKKLAQIGQISKKQSTNRRIFIVSSKCSQKC
jgi:hypothetical protein